MNDPKDTDSLVDPASVPVEVREPVAHPHYPPRPFWSRARSVVTVVDEALDEEESE